MKKLPVTVISGFAQSGKTHVLLNLLRKRSTQERSAVIMNDISELVTATDTVREVLGSDSQRLLELPNGCICCTLKDVFVHTVEKIAESTVDSLYVEGNAAAEPSLIRSSLEESTMAERVCLENMITVIDARTFLQDFLSTDELRHRGLVALSYDDRLVSEVLAEQVECADTLVITKANLVSDTDLAFLEATLSALNPTASISVPGIEKGRLHTKALDRLVFTAERPFHPSRLYAALHTNVFSSVLRARGTAWVATRQQDNIRWSQTGSMCSLESDGPWWGPGSSKQEEQFNAQWFESCGSRYQDIEYIGNGIDGHRLNEALNDCLLTDVEMELGPDLWAHLDDPFEEWMDVMDRSLFVVRDTPFIG